ncbi:MAG: LysR family transcriptional regulator [Atopobiaceae bacterium]|nr:LysR family transcriptional regulator [Atopobiaceae bacterium]
MDMGVQKYRAFVEAVDSGSLAAAASRMGYSISSVSRMVADLEAGCRVRLLERSKAGVRTTPDGERLLARARRVVAACDGFDEEAASIRGIESGTVRIGTVSSVATHILPSTMATFRKAHPQVDFELLLGDYTEIESWLSEGRVDLGALRSPAPRWLKSHLLVHDRLVAVVPEGHPRVAAESFPLKAFTEEPFLALERGSISEVGSLFEAAGIIIQPAFSTWDDYAIMAMVEAGMGLSILPELITRRNAYDIATVPLDVPADRSIDIAWRSTSALPAAARAFLEMVLAS